MPKQPSAHKKNSPRLRHAQDTGEPGGRFILSAAKAAAIACGIGIALLVLLCVVFLSTDDPTKLAPTAARIVLLPTAIVCGVLSAKFSGAGGIPSGAAGGAFLALLLFGMGVLLPDGTAADTAASPLTASLLSAGVCVCLSALSGYFVTHRKPKVRRRR